MHSFSRITVSACIAAVLCAWPSATSDARPRASAAACVAPTTTASDARDAVAQDPGRRAFATRADLEAQLDAAQRRGKTLEAAKIRQRLTQGDFRVGDRILFGLRNNPSFGDTIVVRSGNVLQFPAMADFSLDGVLRSELHAKLAAHIGRYLRDTSLRVMPLVRLGVIGSVRAPGFYYVPADMPLSDILMRAGGPGGDADLRKIQIKRDGKTVVDRSTARVALTDGLSADRLNLEAGDEISLGERRRFPWQWAASTAVAATGIVIAITNSRNRGPGQPPCP